MNRRFLTRGFILACFCLTGSTSYAWDTPPTPIIGYPQGDPLYICREGGQCFDGIEGSYDLDNGEPYGEGNGITHCDWYLYDRQTRDYNWISDISFLCFYPYHFEPGEYCIDLYVTDDEQTRSTTYDSRTVYVIEVEIHEYSDDAMGWMPETPASIYYNIQPEYGWTPSSVTLYIYDNWHTIRTKSLPADVGEQMTTWDGKKDDGTWAPPKYYTAEIVASPPGCRHTHGITVFGDPIAVLDCTPKEYIGVGETVYFFGTSSHDPDGGYGGLLNGIKKFEWDWNNDGTYDYQETPGHGFASHVFSAAGEYTVTMRVTDNDAVEGWPPDRSATDSATLKICPAHPTNFGQVGPGQDMGGGRLRFIYRWYSTAGGLTGLEDCKVGERVDYPSGDDPYVWPRPPWDHRTYNPTELLFPATDGSFQDTHEPGDFIVPYMAKPFSATQNYVYHCDNCMESGVCFVLEGPLSINRQVYWVVPPDSTWRYKVEKSGDSAQMDLP